jgi:hypothetical protein
MLWGLEITTDGDPSVRSVIYEEAVVVVTLVVHAIK